MKLQFDALVTLGAHVEPGNTLSAEGRQRVQTTVNALENDVAPIAIMAGLRPFHHHDYGLRPVAHVMAEYAVNELGAPADRILAQPWSLDTMGDAVFSKREFIAENSWRRLGIVSTESHIPRAEKIFSHVMGSRYHVSGVSSGEYTVDQSRQWLQEAAGTLLAKMVLSGVKPGDDDAIAERLFKIIPGYSDIDPGRRMAAYMGALPRVLRPLS